MNGPNSTHENASNDDRWLVNAWVPILTGPDQVTSRNAAELESESLTKTLRELGPNTALAMTFEGKSLAKRHEFEKHLSDPELRVERHVAFPGTGGGFVLLPLGTAASFSTGTRLLPGGRARWRAARKVLQIGGRFGMASRMRRPELWTIHRRPQDQGDDSGPRGGTAIQSGVPGPDRCVIAQITAPDGEAMGYTKIACGVRGGKRLVHEAEILHEVLALELKHARVPQLFGSDEHGRWVAFSSVGGDRSGDQLLPAHEAFLDELHEATRSETTLPQLGCFRAACDRIAALERDAREDRLTRLAELRDLMLARYSDLEVDAGMAHGDFTPWNLLTEHARPLGVIDWEDARRQAAPFHDELHFLLRVGVLVRHAKPRDLHKQLLDHSERRKGARGRSSTAAPWLALYLIDAVSAHMESCRVARPSFAQVNWLENAHDELVEYEIARLQGASSGQNERGPGGGRSHAA